jgi:hypothetical protein
MREPELYGLANPMGRRFALPYPAVKKLHFVNVVARTERDRYLRKAAG